MIKQLAWNTFKYTGDINSYLEFAQFENTEKDLKLNKLSKENQTFNNLEKEIYQKHKNS